MYMLFPLFSGREQTGAVGDIYFMDLSCGVSFHWPGNLLHLSNVQHQRATNTW